MIAGAWFEYLITEGGLKIIKLEENMVKKIGLSKIALMVLAGLSQPVFAAYPTGSGTNYITTINSSAYGSSGTITFNDWGYVGPSGAGVNDFKTPGTSGFDASQVGQIQKVVTTGPDGNTPDAAYRIMPDFGSLGDLPLYPKASMDSQVNFYKWGYTTVAGSTFNNMQIDKNGNYYIQQQDMKFKFYDTFSYHDTTGVNPDEIVNTGINFQPYAISDAKGWCGSVLQSNPNSLEKMAGQVTFDFAFDVYLLDGHPGAENLSTQVVPGFVMRSYGDYKVDLTMQDGITKTVYAGNAVINNTNPLTGDVDPAFKNDVSFLGAGVISKGVWVTKDSYDANGIKILNVDGTWNVKVAYSDALGSVNCDPSVNKTARSDGAVCFKNSFGGYGFLLRADGTRELFYINPEGHSNYVATDPAAYASIAAVPVPAAACLLGSGLIGLVGVARTRRKSS